MFVIPNIFKPTVNRIFRIYWRKAMGICNSLNINSKITMNKNMIHIFFNFIT